MNKPTPKSDQLRALREAQHEAANRMTAKKVIARQKREARAAAKKAARK